MRGCAELARMHLKGQGMSPDRRRAMTLLERACEEGEASACTSLGIMYVEGRLVGQDVDRAVGYLQQACDNDDLGGCAQLGLLYLRGIGVDENEEEARGLLGRACRGGVVVACSLLTENTWELVAFDMGPDYPRASVRTRSAAGDPASFTIACTPTSTEVSVVWRGRVGDLEGSLTLRVGGKKSRGTAGRSTRARTSTPSVRTPGRSSPPSAHSRIRSPSSPRASRPRRSASPASRASCRPWPVPAPGRKLTDPLKTLPCHLRDRCLSFCIDIDLVVLYNWEGV